LAAANIVTVAADKGACSCQGELRITFGERLLCALVMSDVPGHAKQAHRSSPGIAHNRAFDRNPARLARMPAVRRWHHPILSEPNAAVALCLCKSIVYAHKVIGMNEASRLFKGHGQNVVSMDLR